MLPFERSAPLPPAPDRSAPRTVGALIQAGLARSDRAAAVSPPVETYSSKEVGRTPPVPATFLEPAAGGAFELFPRRQLPRGPQNGGQGGAGTLIQVSLAQTGPANPLMARLLNARRDAAPRQAVSEPVEAPRLRRSA